MFNIWFKHRTSWLSHFLCAILTTLLLIEPVLKLMHVWMVSAGFQWSIITSKHFTGYNRGYGQRSWWSGGQSSGWGSGTGSRGWGSGGSTPRASASPPRSSPSTGSRTASGECPSQPLISRSTNNFVGINWMLFILLKASVEPSVVSGRVRSAFIWLWSSLRQLSSCSVFTDLLKTVFIVVYLRKEIYSLTK